MTLPERDADPSLATDLDDPSNEASRPLRGALLRFLVFVALLFVGFVILTRTPIAEYLDRERLLATFETLQTAWWAPLALVGLFLVVAPMGVPVSPLVICGGAVFGAALGTLYNLSGLFLGSVASFFLARALGRDLVAHFAGDRLRKVERLFDRHGFWPLVQARFVPFPFAVVNYGAALAGVRVVQFLSSTALGLAPSTLMHTFFSSAIIRAPSEKQPWIALSYGLVWGLFGVLTALPTLVPRWRRRRRYREILAQRRERGN